MPAKSVGYLKILNYYTRVGTLIVATIYLPPEESLEQFWSECHKVALLKVSYDFHIAGNGLYTMLVTTLKDSKTSKHVSILYQL